MNFFADATGFFTPFLVGLAGSLHCAGMCGPLLLAVNPPGKTWQDTLTRSATYHAGRILIYAALGLFFGYVGKGFAVAGFQKIISIAGGGVMIVMALATWRFEQIVRALPGMNRFFEWVQTQIGRTLRRQSHSASFSLGALNGLLPCGLVYAALAGAISTTEGVEGAAFMILFGLGTLPLLLATSLLGKTARTFRARLRWVQPVLLL
ncbi:MAG: sulfite exporter TauE/SafE family protein, partial [Phycisphaerales bacterium]|nr:sulfite exporter TauE/SafE family protein [Phycisphaerales bacterium]